MISIAIGILLLFLGAEALVRGSSRLAALFGIPPIVIGLTVVAFATSAPELTVSLSAAMNGSSDVALGNVVGSNIANIALILGLTALIRPPAVHLNLIRREIPFLILVSAVGLGLVVLGTVSRPVGITLFLGLCVYLSFAIRSARRHPEDVAMDVPNTGAMPQWLCWILIAGGLGVLVLGARLFVVGAVATARDFAVSEAVIALTIVAAGTSLPELATSVVAAIKKESDVAIGNIVGSSIFNILCILGLTAAALPLEATDVGFRDAAFMFGTALLLLPFAFSKQSISRGEGAVFLVIYGVYLYGLWPREAG